MNIETLLIYVAIGFVIIAAPFLIWAYKADKKRMAKIKEFQKTVRVGSDTDVGIVVRIEGHFVVTENYTDIKDVWPPPRRKK